MLGDEGARALAAPEQASSSIARRASRRWPATPGARRPARARRAGGSRREPSRSIRCLSSSWTETERSRGRDPGARCGLCILARSIRQTTQPGSRSLTRYGAPLTIRPSSVMSDNFPDAVLPRTDEQGGCDVAPGATPSRLGQLRGGRRGLLRQTPAAPARGLLVAVVAGGGGRHLRRFLRLEPGPGRRRVGGC